jgi:tetratricopeptide (TPR) repeat protein
MAMTYDNEKEYDDAIKLYKKAIELDDKYDRAYFFLANAYDEIGEKEKAIECYQKVNELNPEDYWAYVNLGVIYEEQNQNSLAKEATQKALEIEPDHYKALFNMGVILKKLGNIEESKLYYYKSIEEEAYYQYSYLNLGVIYIEEKEYKKAIEIFDQGIDNNPNAASLFYNRACCYAQLQEPEAALRDVIKALEAYPPLLEFMKSDRELESIRGLQEYKKLFE